ncbi:MAG: hypothetical protein MI919_29665, partial [Holophagales bacterium]|nr:hypothetical protein [Holophagales bacterium]
MRSLTAEMAIQAWERGQRTDPIGRSLALLSMALPDLDRQELAHITISQRDALLFQLRGLTFGKEFKGFAMCPQCGTRLEFPLDLDGFPVEDALESRLREERFEHEGYEIHYRLPNGLDLEAASHVLTVEEAREQLLRRTVLGVRGPDGEEITDPPHLLPGELVEALEAHLARTDPLVDVLLEIDCGRCHHQWRVL